MAELDTGVDEDAKLLGGIVQASFNVLYGLVADDPLTDDDLRWVCRQVMEACHHAAAQPGAVAADADHVALLAYCPQTFTNVQDLMTAVQVLFGEWAVNLRTINQRLPASQWMVIGSFFRHGLLLMHGDPDASPNAAEGAAVEPTPLLDVLLALYGADSVLRAVESE